MHEMPGGVCLLACLLGSEGLVIPLLVHFPWVFQVRYASRFTYVVVPPTPTAVQQPYHISLKELLALVNSSSGNSSGCAVLSATGHTLQCAKCGKEIKHGGSDCAGCPLSYYGGDDHDWCAEVKQVVPVSPPGAHWYCDSCLEVCYGHHISSVAEMHWCRRLLAATCVIGLSFRPANCWPIKLVTLGCASRGIVNHTTGHADPSWPACLALN